MAVLPRSSATCTRRPLANGASGPSPRWRRREVSRRRGGDGHRRADGRITLAFTTATVSVPRSPASRRRCRRTIEDIVERGRTDGDLRAPRTTRPRRRSRRTAGGDSAQLPAPRRRTRRRARHVVGLGPRGARMASRASVKWRRAASASSPRPRNRTWCVAPRRTYGRGGPGSGGAAPRRPRGASPPRSRRRCGPRSWGAEIVQRVWWAALVVGDVPEGSAFLEKSTE